MTVEWSVPVGQTRSITMALHSLAGDVRTNRGCLGCSVSSDMANRGVVRYVEEWRTEEDLRRRLKDNSFVQLITLMENAGQPPLLEFALGNGTRGFEFLEEVRGARLHD
jgi:quinol monooxygenase YgiN